MVPLGVALAFAYYFGSFGLTVLNFCLALAILSISMTKMFFFKPKQGHESITFQVRSNSDFVTGLLGFWPLLLFVDDHWDMWNILAVAMVLFAVGLELINNYPVKYSIDENGIIRLNGNKKEYKAVYITQVEILERKVSVHTTKYKNDLVITHENFEGPDWNTFTQRIQQLGTVWAGNN